MFYYIRLTLYHTYCCTNYCVTEYERWDDISSDELDNDDENDNDNDNDNVNGHHISKEEGEEEGEGREGGGENDDDSDYSIERYIAGTYVLTITYCTLFINHFMFTQFIILLKH